MSRFLCFLIAVICMLQVDAFSASGRFVGLAQKQRQSVRHLQSTSISRPQLVMVGEFVWKDFKKGVEQKFSKCIESTQAQLNTVRAGGANPAILDRVFVDYFGTPTPLNQVARVAASGSQQLVIEPFDKSVTKEIEKAISTSDLNLTPTNDGSGIIRINIPPLTEERRKDLTKQAKTIVEDGKVAIRNVRRDAVDKVKAEEKNKAISKDDSKGFQDDLQKVTDEQVKKLDAMLKTKEKDLMTI